MVSQQIYDSIGKGYARLRRPDPRISLAISEALGGAETVINVGAGAGSYEPEDKTVIAVEPSTTMIAQRTDYSAPVVQATAEALPFGDNSFDAGMAVLTIHHWRDLAGGLSELMRAVRGPVAVVTYDPNFTGFWLVEDYFPEIMDIDRESMPTIGEVTDVLGEVNVTPLPIPHDCTDGFLGAYWRRPEMYLDSNVREPISAFTKIADMEPGLAGLRRDLADGTWRRRNGHLLGLEELDLGYRIVVANGDR